MTDKRQPGNEEVIAHIDAAMDSHVKVFHAFTAEELVPMVREHRALIDDIHGEPHPTAADPERRIGGVIATLEDLKAGQDDVRAQLSNGGIRTKLPPAFYTTVVTSATAIIVAIIYALNQTH